MEELFSNTILWIWFSFIIFVVAAYLFGRHAVAGQLDAKIEDIRKKIETAESLRVEAQEMLAQYQRKQRDSLKESEQIIENAKERAAKLREQTEQELDEMVSRRETMLAARITHMKETAINDLQEQVADIAIRAAEQVIAENMDKKSSARLIEDSIGDISSCIRQ